MSCSSRVKKSGGRRLDNSNSSNNNNRRSLLFLLGSSSSDGMSNHPASAWFHNSLQHLSHSWHRFNKFGISRDKKADRCSTWFVDQADNNNKPLPFFSFSRFVFCPDCVYLYIFRQHRRFPPGYFYYQVNNRISFKFLGEQSAKNRLTFSIDFQKSANVQILKGFRPEDVRMRQLKKHSLEPTGSTSWIAKEERQVLN